MGFSPHTKAILFECWGTRKRAIRYSLSSTTYRPLVRCALAPRAATLVGFTSLRGDANTSRRDSALLAPANLYSRVSAHWQRARFVHVAAPFVLCAARATARNCARAPHRAPAGWQSGGAGTYVQRRASPQRARNLPPKSVCGSQVHGVHADVAAARRIHA